MLQQQQQLQRKLFKCMCYMGRALACCLSPVLFSFVVALSQVSIFVQFASRASVAFMGFIPMCFTQTHTYIRRHIQAILVAFISSSLSRSPTLVMRCSSSFVAASTKNMYPTVVAICIHSPSLSLSLSLSVLAPLAIHSRLFHVSQRIQNF